ncbi:hypothetical protein V1525DRAFT_396609 [Lipomyces kononenkoae]|uniref:Uncharacterized protein n=1 Tax=Lipomyces kononenkoae TaxID=34357 RepID=A0ACC3T998_LIPKO
MSASAPTHASSLWARIASMFAFSGPVRNSGGDAPLDKSTSPKTDVVSSARFSVFSPVSPLSTFALLASLISGPKSFVSHFLGLTFTSPKRIASKLEPAPAITLPERANTASVTDAPATSSPAGAAGTAPAPAQTASLFPQIILDVRLTAAAPARTTSSASESKFQTATPCATDPSVALLQVHNAKGELVGFDLSEPGMMQSSSSYMFQFAPQVQQFQAQQQFVPCYGQLDQQVVTPPPDSSVDQNDFLSKLDELEIYISEMRNKLAASGAPATSMGFADDGTSPGSVPRVARHRSRHERQSVAAPYNRPVYSHMPSYALDGNDANTIAVPSPDQTFQAAPELLLPTEVNHRFSSPSISTASSTYSPIESATWSPHSLVDGRSPASASVDDNYFAARFTDQSGVHPEVKFFEDSASLDASVANVADHDAYEYVKDESKLIPNFQPEHMMPYHNPAAGLPAQFVPPAHDQHQCALDSHAQFIYNDYQNQMPFVQGPVPQMVDVSSTVSSSPRSSMGSPHRSSISDSPVSSNSSPSSSPGKQHAIAHSPSSSPHQHSSAPAFQCPHCPSKFRIKGYLTRHLKKHAINKAYTCPFFDPTSSTPCHSTGGFSRRDTYKTHLKSRHFVYPAGTRSDQRAGMRGWCAACGMLFACNENWVENHVEGGECRAFHGIPLYA